MLVFPKPGADFSRGCAHPAMQPRLFPRPTPPRNTKGPEPHLQGSGQAAQGDKLEALYVLAIQTGMRCGELLGLKWPGIDLDNATVGVRRTLTRTDKGKGYTLGEPPQRSLVPLLKRADLPRITFHDLRHTCASLPFQRNVHPKLVQDLLGHASVAITLDTYSHMLPGMGSEAADAMGEALG